MLKKNGYHEQIAYELADLFLLHIRLAFERGIFSGIKAHMEHSEPQTNPSNQSNPFDMYIPSIKVQIEVDEDHHNDDKNKKLDAMRQEDIDSKIHCMNALERTQIINIPEPQEPIRIRVTDNDKKVLSLGTINKAIEEAVKTIQGKIEKLKPDSWDYESEYSWRKYKDKTSIKVADNIELRYISDVHNIFGGTKGGGKEFTEGAQTRAYWPYPSNQQDQYIWCPKKGHDKWNNEMDESGKFIYEKVEEKADMNKQIETEPSRVTFYHSRDNLGQTFYRFCGVFKYIGVVDKTINYKVVKCSQYEKFNDEINIDPFKPKLN